MTVLKRSQFKEVTVETSVPARDFNLNARVAINLTLVIRQDWALNFGPF